MKDVLLVLLTIVLAASVSYAQRSVGLLSYDQELAYDGYNLIYPHNQSTVYLLDNCGEVVHEWIDSSIFRPGNAAYIVENGDLYKCKRRSTSAVNDPIWAGGGGESVEVRSWDNELISTFFLNDSLFRLHHDIAPMPNGNVLMIAWEYRSLEESLAAGRIRESLDQDKLWSEVILEWDPFMDSIVWRWSVWDHLVQDVDQSLDNYGVIADHPERIDINYDTHDGHPDWLHINAIDYNPVLDQFILSVPYFNEMWVVDHSTTIEEAASRSGGRSGKGGDLLFRWGNPAAYNQGGEDDQQLYFQHDTHWTNPNAQPGESDFGVIAVFNNRATPSTSPGHLIKTDITTESFSYSMSDGRFLPQNFQETRFHPEAPGVAVSSGLSSVQVLENGNWLFLSGRWGYAYEITEEDEIVWEYRVPLKGGQEVNQGDTLDVNNNLTFRMQRYAPDYAAFEDRDLSAKGVIEIDESGVTCDMIVPTEEVSIVTGELFIYPNPANSVINLSGSGERITIYNMQGGIMESFDASHMIDVRGLSNGTYMLGQGRRVKKFVIIR